MNNYIYSYYYSYKLYIWYFNKFMRDLRLKSNFIMVVPGYPDRTDNDF